MAVHPRIDHVSLLWQLLTASSHRCHGNSLTGCKERRKTEKERAEDVREVKEENENKRGTNTAADCTLHMRMIEIVL